MNNQLEIPVRVNIPFFRMICLSAFLLMGILFFFPVSYSTNETAALAVPLIVLVCGIVMNKKLKLDKWTAEIYIFLCFWIIYALVGMIWVKDTNLASYYIRRIVFYLLTFVIFSQLLRNRKYRVSAPLIIQLFFLGYCAINVWEMITWQHLSNSRLYNIPIPVPTGAYFNENNQAVFLMLMAPFLTVKTGLTASKLGKTAALILFLFMILVAAIQSSRLALAVMVLMGLYYFIRAGWYLKIVSLVLIILSLSIFITGFTKEAKTAKLVFKRQLESTINENTSFLMTSSKIRTQLNRESFKLGVDSKLFGFGAGTYEIYLRNTRYHRTALIVNPHNWWMEIFAAFGLVITLGMIFMYLRWLFRLWQLRQASTGKEFARYDAYLISLLAFIPLSIVPSSIDGYYSIWIYFGLIHAVCACEKPQVNLLKS